MLTVKNMSFKTGQEMKITGKATSATGFSINIGHNEESVALHFNPRFCAHGDSNTIVCNSKKGGAWQTETRDSSFPFHTNEEFKVSIQFSGDSFNIKLSNGHNIHFPNRFGDSKFKHIHFEGDVRIHSFKIK
ncbi:beta-galactoside-binding lectin-like [Engraulis encrasicolus]|uniref:beta-galactoside-binding lectin-like n=1 Tax=Engraulis encrasicolus TaxID=184585 RepID=UPI002FD18ECE